MSFDPTISPWVPMSKAIDLKHLGKLQEELGEATAVVSRCLIQGINAFVPHTAKPNREWLQEELADVLANIGLVVEHFNLDIDAMDIRMKAKKTRLRVWHEMLNDKGE